MPELFLLVSRVGLLNLLNDKIRDHTSYAAKVVTPAFRGDTTVCRILRSCYIILTLVLLTAYRVTALRVEG